VGFVVDKAALGQVFSEYFSFPCHSFQRLLHTHHYPSSGADIACQIVVTVPNGLNITQPHEKELLYSFLLHNHLLMLQSIILLQGYPGRIFPV
jgi:hypothetical protein